MSPFRKNMKPPDPPDPPPEKPKAFFKNVRCYGDGSVSFSWRFAGFWNNLWGWHKGVLEMPRPGQRDPEKVEREIKKFVQAKVLLRDGEELLRNMKGSV